MNEEALEGLCIALQSLLQYELKRGNRILAIDTGWSKVELAVRLAAPLDMAYIKNMVAHNPDLEIWTSSDVKNPRESGVLCKSAKQTLSGSIS